MVWPLAKKVLIALGIGWVTYEGISLLTTQVQAAVIAQWGQLGGSTLQIISLGGGSESLGIILGALSARATLMAVSRLGKVAQ